MANNTISLATYKAILLAKQPTLTIGATGKTFNGTVNVSFSASEILGSSTSAYFYRGDQTWSNSLSQRFILEENNSWLSPARLQLLRPDTTAYTDRACIGVTDGNLHLDPYPNKGLYLNYYNSVGNVYFNGSTYYINGGNYNGTSAKATNDVDGYDIRQRYVNVYNTSNIGNSSAVTFTNLAAAGNAVGMIYAATDNPHGSAAWTHCISLCWGKGTTSSWISQIAIGVGDGMWYRTTSGNIAGLAWKRVLDSSNWSSYCAAASHTHNYVPISGGTLTGRISVTNSSADLSANPSAATIELREALRGGTGITHSANNAPRIGFHWGNRYWAQVAYYDNAFRFYNNALTGYVPVYGSAVYNAVWNDLAEYRKSFVNKPGHAITPSGTLTTNRLEPGARIVSDTYGMCMGDMGDENDSMAPVALAGRVLAHPYRVKDQYHIGDAVCSAPGGTIDIMTREEIMMYPERVLGIVNEIPDYDIWEPSLVVEEGRAPVHTNGRIWIDVR